MRTCATCRYYGPGECRRNPPSIATNDGGYTRVVWLNTTQADWCGKWKKLKGEEDGRK